MEIFRGAHKVTLAYKIYLKRNISDTCYLLKRNAGFGSIVNDKNLKRLFFLTADAAKDFAPKITQALGRQNTYINLNPICESIRTLIVRQSLRKDIKDFLNYGVNLYASFGVFQRAINGFTTFQSEGHSVPKTGKDGFLNFDNLNDYIEHHSLVAPLTFIQLDYLFRIYFSILALLLALNMAHYAQVRLANHAKHRHFKLLKRRLFSSLVHPVANERSRSSTI